MRGCLEVDGGERRRQARSNGPHKILKEMISRLNVAKKNEWNERISVKSLSTVLIK